MSVEVTFFKLQSYFISFDHLDIFEVVSLATFEESMVFSTSPSTVLPVLPIPNFEELRLITVPLRLGFWWMDCSKNWMD